MKNILVICAHPDDEVFGAGGTVAKYAQEGYKIDVIIFSYGEQSHPWLKKHFVVKTRIAESKDASRILGTKSLTFFGLGEGHFEEDSKTKDIHNKISAIIKRKKPVKIFTHSIDDPHPDHKTVYNTVLESLKKSRHKCDVYTFDIWNPVNLGKRKTPRLYVDISKTFSRKIEALKCFKSQKVSMVSLLWSVYTRAVTSGIQNSTKFAEVFYKAK